ncbi:MAG: mechanosensitive ion channel family protein [Bacteroidia bacterium]
MEDIGSNLEWMSEFSLDWKTSVMIIIIIIGAILLTRATRWLADRLYSTVASKAAINTTRFNFVKNALSIIVWILAFAAIVSMIPRLKAIAITLFAGAGIMVAIIGLAAQKAFSNIISGIVMIIFEPFKVGDVISVEGEHFGMVEDITLRHTVINNLENQLIIIPNSVISAATIINESIYFGLLCKWMDIGISYDSDIELATRIIHEETDKHPNVVREPGTDYPNKVNVRVVEYADFSVNLRCYVWTNNARAGIQIQSDLYKSIKARFDLEGIEIPFPYRTIVFKNDLPNKPQIDINPE